MDGLASARGADPFHSSSFSPDTNKRTVSCWHQRVRPGWEHTSYAPGLLVHPICVCAFPSKSWARQQPLGECPTARGRYPELSTLWWAAKTSLLACKPADSSLAFLHVAGVRRVGRSSTNTEGWNFSYCFVLKLSSNGQGPLS